MTGRCVDNMCGPICTKGVSAPPVALSSHFKAFPLSTHLSTTCGAGPAHRPLKSNPAASAKLILYRSSQLRRTGSSLSRCPAWRTWPGRWRRGWLATAATGGAARESRRAWGPGGGEGGELRADGSHHICSNGNSRFGVSYTRESLDRIPAPGASSARRCGDDPDTR